MVIQIAPSILSADFGNLQAAMTQVAQADLVHVDVMDGHFVPNLTIGQPVTKRLAQISPLPLDVHLMIDQPDRWAADYALPGVEAVTFHLEASLAPVRLAQLLRSCGVKAGVAINPGTPVSALVDIAPHIDQILIMGVEPGFSGQDFIEQSYAKLAQAHQLATKFDHPITIEIDGGATLQRLARLVGAGATIVVAGSAIFGAADPASEVTAFRAALDQLEPDQSGS